jgi:hypothetical protein
MNLGRMTQRVWTILGSDADDHSAADVAHELQRAYRFTIVNRVGPPAFSRLYSLQLLAGKGDYELPSHIVRDVSPPAQRANWKRLTYYTDPDSFWRAYDPFESRSGDPHAILVLGRQLYVRYVPTADEQIYLNVVRYRDAFDPTIGITNEDEAQICIHFAAMQLASDDDNDEVARRQDNFGMGLLATSFAMYKGGKRTYTPLRSGYDATGREGRVY